MMANGQIESKHYHDEYSTKQTKKFQKFFIKFFENTQNFTKEFLQTYKCSSAKFREIAFQKYDGK